MNVFVLGNKIDTPWYGKIEILGKLFMQDGVFSSDFGPRQVRETGQVPLRAVKRG